MKVVWGALMWYGACCMLMVRNCDCDCPPHADGRGKIRDVFNILSSLLMNRRRQDGNVKSREIYVDNKVRTVIE